MKEKFQNEIRSFTLAQKLETFDSDYWLAVIRGLILLMGYKDAGLKREELNPWYEEVRVEICHTDIADIYHDFTNELSAMLIGYYSEPDFWKDGLEKFKNHINYKRYFDLL